MHEWLFQTESATAYLANATQTLSLLSEQLDHALRLSEAAGEQVSPRWALQYCSGLFVIARELERCRHDLDAAIDAAYKSNKGDRNEKDKLCSTAYI